MLWLGFCKVWRHLSRTLCCFEWRCAGTHLSSVGCCCLRLCTVVERGTWCAERGLHACKSSPRHSNHQIGNANIVWVRSDVLSAYSVVLLSFSICILKQRSQCHFVCWSLILRLVGVWFWFFVLCKWTLLMSNPILSFILFCICMFSVALWNL